MIADVPGRTLDPARFIRTLYEDDLAFSGGTEQADDLTALVMRRSVQPLAAIP